MATEEDILAVLTGKKVFDGNTWRVYDATDTELASSDGVLWRGVHGALLWGINRIGRLEVLTFFRRRMRR